MNLHAIAFLVAPLTFVSGLAGLRYQSWQPAAELAAETRDFINHTTGLVATLSALALGLLIVDANSFYNSQKASLELLAARAVQLDEVLHLYGPEAQPARDQLKEMISRGYKQIWQSGDSTSNVPTIEGSKASMGAMFGFFNGLRPTASETQKYLLSRADDLISSIADQRMLMSLQLSTPLSSPLLAILVSWTSLMFFGFGMLARVNFATVIVMAAGAFSVASAIFLIVELNSPYDGILRLSPAPVLMAISALAN